MEELILGNLTQRKIGYGIVQPGENVSSGVHIIKVNNIITGLTQLSNLDSTTTEIEKKYSRTRLRGNELIISIVGTIGKTAIVPKEFAGCNIVRAIALIDIQDRILTLWVKYYIDSPKGQEYIKENLNTTVQPTLNIKSLSNMPIPFYSTTYTQKVVDILSTIDNKILLNKQINENLEQQAQALFKSWFVDFEPFKDGKFVDSELGMIPEGWKAVETNKIMRISKESINPTKNPNRFYAHYSIPAFDEIGLPIFQYGNDIKSNKQKVLDNMTLVSKLNPRIKRVWFIDKACENAICSTEFIPYLSLNNSPYFLYCYLNSNIFYDSIMSFVNGATGSHQRFQANDTLKFLFPYNEEVICKFNSIVSGVLIHKSRLIDENMKLSQLRDTLLPKLMSGELKINDFND